MSYEGRSWHKNTWAPCCRHYIKFNGNECTTPGTIEGINYLNKNTNLHRPNISKFIYSSVFLYLLLVLSFLGTFYKNFSYDIIINGICYFLTKFHSFSFFATAQETQIIGNTKNLLVISLLCSVKHLNTLIY